MLKVVFKNLKKSPFLEEKITERIDSLMRKFPDLLEHKIRLTIEMENSPFQAGPDLFSLSAMIHGKTFKNLKVKKSASHFYSASADLFESLHQLLGKEIDRLSKKSQRRKLANQIFYDEHLSAS